MSEHMHNPPDSWTLLAMAQANHAGDGERLDELAEPWSHCLPAAVTLGIATFHMATLLSHYAGHTLALGIAKGETDQPTPVDELPAGLRLATLVGNHVASGEWEAAGHVYLEGVRECPGDERIDVLSTIEQVALTALHTVACMTPGR